MKTKFFSFLLNHKVDLFFVIVFILAGLKLTYGIANSLDVLNVDEGALLWQGINLPSVGFQSAEWSPLYSFWYYCLSFFESDPLHLYYLNCKLLAIFFPVFLFLLLRTIRIPLLPSILVTFLILISRANLPQVPKTVHLALIFVSLFLILSHKAKANLLSLSLIATGALLASFVRPEFFLSYVLFVGLIFIVSFIEVKNRRFSHNNIFPIIILLFISIVVINIFGLPMFIKDSRCFGSFAHHVCSRWVEWTNANMDPYDNWVYIMSINFGDADTISQAFINNPSLVLKCMAFNFRKYFVVFFNTFSINYSVLLSAFSFILKIPARTNWRLFEGYLLLVSITIYMSYTRREWMKNAIVNFKENKRLLFYVFILLLPSSISVILIYPKHYYITMQGVLLIAILALFLTKRAKDTRGFGNSTIILLGLLIILLTPQIPAKNWVHLNSIRFLRSLKIKEQINLCVLENVRYYVFLDDNFRQERFRRSKEQTFSKFFNDKNINMIIAKKNQKFDTIATLRYTDQALIDFLKDYESYGFSKMDIPNTNKYVLLRKDIYESLEKF